MSRAPMLAYRTTRQHTRHFRKIMNALPFYKTRLAKAREAMIQMEAEIAELKSLFESSKRERDNALSDFRQADTDSIRALQERNEAREQRDALAEALMEMRYGHTDKAEEMAIEALNYLTK